MTNGDDVNDGSTYGDYGSSNGYSRSSTSFNSYGGQNENYTSNRHGSRSYGSSNYGSRSYGSSGYGSSNYGSRSHGSSGYGSHGREFPVDLMPKDEFAYQTNPDYETEPELSKAEEFQQTLKGLILGLGDNRIENVYSEKEDGKKFQEEISEMASVLIDHFDELEEFITSILMASIEVFPWKRQTYAALISFLNIKNKEIAKKLLFQAMEKLKSYTGDNFDGIGIKMWLQFLVELVNFRVFDSKSYDDFIEGIFQLAQSSESQKKNCYVGILLGIAPGYFHCKNEEFTKEFLGRIQNILSNQDNKMTSVIHDESKKYICDPIQYAFESIKSMTSKKQMLSLTTLFQEFKEALSESIPHEYDGNIDFSTEIMAISSMKARLGLHEVKGETLNCFSENEFSQLPSELIMSTEDLIQDVLFVCKEKPELCVENLLRIPVQNAQHILIDVLFGHILQLPKSRYSILLYSRLLTLIGRKNDDSLHAINRYVDVLFELTEKLDEEAVRRMVNWLAHHICDYNYQLPWEHWTRYIQGDSPQNGFLSNLVLEIKTMKGENSLRHMLPNDYQPLISDFRFQLTENEASKELLVLLNESPDKVHSYLSENSEQRLKDLLTALLISSQYDFSILYQNLVCYMDIVSTYISSEEDRQEVIELTLQAWKTDFSKTVHFLEQFILAEILSVADIVKFFLSNNSHNWSFRYIVHFMDYQLNRIGLVLYQLDLLKNEELEQLISGLSQDKLEKKLDSMLTVAKETLEAIIGDSKMATIPTILRNYGKYEGKKSFHDVDRFKGEMKVLNAILDM